MPADNTEGLSHKELHALVSGARPGDISTRSDSISAAATKILAISNDLDRMVKKAEWTGQSGDALRTWTQSFVKQGRQLGAFATIVSNALFVAGTGLTEAKTSMPKPKSGGNPSTGEGTEKDRQEALTVITRLNSYYREATTDVTGYERPHFTPIDVPELSSGGPGVPRGTTPAGGGQPQGATDTVLPGGRAAGLTGNEAAALPGPASPPAVDSRIRTDLDSAATAMPATRQAPPSTSPALPSAGGPTSQVPMTLGQPMSPTAGTANDRSRVSGSVRPVPPTTPGLPGPGGRAGALPTGPGTAVPSGPGSHRGGGIHGGAARPVNTGPTQAGMPRGTVIGGQQAGTPNRMGAGGYSPASPGRTTGSGEGTPRHGRATQQGGTAGSPRSGVPTSASPSNVGGSLSRPPQVVGPGSSPSERSRRTKGQRRPDYLTEQEETWSGASRKIVPPVIDN